MRLSTWLVLSFVLIAACPLVCPAETPAAEPAKKINLRILYVGHPGSEHEKNFLSFLSEHFTSVKTGDLAKFEENQVSDCDVVILDYDGDGFEAPHPTISPDYKKATIAVGVTGALIASAARLKTGYL